MFVYTTEPFKRKLCPPTTFSYSFPLIEMSVNVLSVIEFEVSSNKQYCIRAAKIGNS